MRCLFCNEPFHPQSSARRFCTRAHYIAWYEQKARVLVRCAWRDCPRPDDLVVAPRYRPRGYHAACQEAARHARERRGKVLFCEICKGEIGYRPPSQLGIKYHHACAHRLRGQGKPRHGVMRPCDVCGTLVYRTGTRATSPHVFCSSDHSILWRQQRTAAARAAGHEGAFACEVRCVGCGHVSRYKPSGVPRTVDAGTMTWTCPACRPRVSVVGPYTCAQCGVVKVKRLRDREHGNRHFCSWDCRVAWRTAHKQPLVTLVCAYCQMEAQEGKRSRTRVTFERPRWYVRTARMAGHNTFCTARHRDLYVQAKRRRTRRCRQCGEIVQRKGRHVVFCDKTCYSAWKNGRSLPNPRAADAEARIRVVWQTGERRIRVLAQLSEASVNTVYKLQRAGKLVEPARPAPAPPGGYCI